MAFIGHETPKKRGIFEYVPEPENWPVTTLCFPLFGIWVVGLPLSQQLAGPRRRRQKIGAASAEPLQEIIVTAQKREQRAQDVAITLNVYTRS